MDSQHLQQIFFDQLQNNLPEHISLVDEVCDALDISMDGAYRRIRGEKLLSFEEVKSLSSKYSISVDQIFNLNLNTDTFSFTGNIADWVDFTYERWLKSLCIILDGISQSPNHHVYYFTKQALFPCYFSIPELAEFQSFLMMKSVFGFENEEPKNKRFSINNTDSDKYRDVWRKLDTLYMKISCTEIWNIENINSTINQILFYTTLGTVVKSEALILLEKMEELLNHMELQVEHGKKFSMGQQPQSSLVKFNVYINNLFTGDGTILVEQDDHLSTFIGHSIINFINTNNDSFNRYMKKTIEDLLQKSTCISDLDNTQERLEFFNSCRNLIHITKQKLK